MPDPHVKFLLYSVFSQGGTEYVDPKPLAFDNHLGHFQIDDGKLQIEPVAHFRDEDEAKAVIGPFLEAWEIETDLVENPGTIRFRFETAHVIDRGSPMTQHVPGLSVRMAVGQPHLRLVRHSYPQPPDPEAFRITDDLAIAFPRWRNYRDGKEGFLAMAYFVLTVLENPAITREKAAGSSKKRVRARREKAAEVFAVDYDILDKLGELSAAGDAATARKVENKSFRALSASEEAWIEQAVRRLIRRLGERASGAALVPITIQDLPLS